MRVKLKLSRIDGVRSRLEDPRWVKKKKTINRTIERLTKAEDKAFDKLLDAIYKIEKYSQAANIIRLLFKQRSIERQLSRAKRSVGRA